jgi:sugar phosphate isomerase/epimerase
MERLGDPAKLSRFIAACEELGEYGKAKGVRVLIENHGKAPGEVEDTVPIIKGAGPRSLCDLPSAHHLFFGIACAGARATNDGPSGCAFVSGGLER